MFQVDNLTGHVRMRPRQELARTVRYVAEKIGLATPTKAGLMPAADKAKLDGLGLATAGKDGLMPAADKAKLDGLGLATANKDGLMPATDKAKLDGLGLATAGKDGLMSKADKAKLDRLRATDCAYCIQATVTAQGISFPSISLAALKECNYFIFEFSGEYSGATTFNLNFFRPGLMVNQFGFTYMLCVNNSASDINIIAGGFANDGWYAPDDTVVKTGSVREVSLIAFESGGPSVGGLALTMSEPLILKN